MSAFRALTPADPFGFSHPASSQSTSTKAGKFTEEFEKLWEDFEPE